MERSFTMIGQAHRVRYCKMEIRHKRYSFELPENAMVHVKEAMAEKDPGII